MALLQLKSVDGQTLANAFRFVPSDEEQREAARKINILFVSHNHIRSNQGALYSNVFPHAHGELPVVMRELLQNAVDAGATKIQLSTCLKDIPSHVTQRLSIPDITSPWIYFEDDGSWRSPKYTSALEIIMK